MKFLKGRGRSRGTNPKQFDECIYSPFNYEKSETNKKKVPKNLDGVGNTLDQAPTPPLNRERRYSDSVIEVDETRQQRRDELISSDPENESPSLENGESSNGIRHSSKHERAQTPDFDTQVHTPEVFLFDYGTVVIWGMTLQHEQRFLQEIAKFESEKLSEHDVQTENFNFYYTREYQARIYNDFISLREKKNYMTKLAISHALAQSVKVVPLSPTSFSQSLPFF